MRSIRELAVNLDHWYAAAPIQDLGECPLGVTIWEQPVVLFRDAGGKVHALEDRCPHRLVRLSHGRVLPEGIECAYHGWRFDGHGHCIHLPYGELGTRAPGVRTYPVRESDGFIWIFPGDPARASSVAPLALPEWDHLDYIASVAPIVCDAHFSYLLENLMDMHHGHLHNRSQAWGAARLQGLSENEQRVDAVYEVENYYRIDRIWSVLQLYFPSMRRPHPDTLTTSCLYPHWRGVLGEDFRIYCLLCPSGSHQTRAWLVHFTSLGAFEHLHSLPVGVRRFFKDAFFGSAQNLLARLVVEDVQMIEEEQQAYLRQPELRPREPNPALAAAQRLIRRQANGIAAVDDEN